MSMPLKQKKRLLIATDSFLPRWDGVARVLKEILPFLAQTYDVTVLAPDFPGKVYKFTGVKIVRFPLMNVTVGDYTPARPSLKVVKQLVKQSDIIWGQTIGPIGAFSMYYARRYKKPLLAYIHSVEWELFSNSLKRFKRIARISTKLAVRNLYNKCDLLIVPSQTTQEELEKIGIKSKKEIVHLGVDVEKFKPVKDRIRAKEKLGIKKDTLVVGFLGRFGREKSLITLYDSFRVLCTEFKNLQLLLVGGTKESLSDVFDKFENIKIVEPTDMPEAYYKAMDVYVLPSLTETTSLTTLEAMSTSLPVVCTSVGHIPLYIEHKYNGFLFPPKSSERLTIILRMLLNDEKLRERLGKRARRTITSEYAWKQTAAKIEEVISRFA